ncbi:hypothetical protein KAX02_04300 [candidate division WOR-3 bacterium]|nr:hypothetical protein [candidate division WOR-3 bacterium]
MDNRLYKKLLSIDVLKRAWQLVRNDGRGNFIQFLIFLVLLGTCIFGIINVKQHSKYYRNSIRPYVKCIPRRGIEINDGYVRYEYFIENKGKTPAYKVKSYSTPTSEEVFPVDTFIRKIKKDPGPLRSIIFQEDTMYGSSNKIPTTYGDNKPISRTDIIQSIKEGERKLYIHFYFEFIDVNGKQYFLRSSYLLTDFKESKEICDCNWAMIDVSETPIIVKNSND